VTIEEQTKAIQDATTSLTYSPTFDGRRSDLLELIQLISAIADLRIEMRERERKEQTNGL